MYRTTIRRPPAVIYHRSRLLRLATISSDMHLIPTVLFMYLAVALATSILELLFQM